jgi:NAD(P)-dependent dehydrogenase (short-subunit alcohol dehydrogenase family)
MRDLRDKAVLVTGAASGIGRAAAIAFALEGAGPLMLNDVNVSGLRETAGIIERLGTPVVLLPADVSDPAAVNSIVETALAEAGRIDILVNVAGIGILSPVEDLDHEDWEKVLGVDLWGVINTVSAVLPAHDRAARGTHRERLFVDRAVQPGPLPGLLCRREARCAGAVRGADARGARARSGG